MCETEYTTAIHHIELIEAIQHKQLLETETQRSKKRLLTASENLAETNRALEVLRLTSEFLATIEQTESVVKKDLADWSKQLEIAENQDREAEYFERQNKTLEEQIQQKAENYCETINNFNKQICENKEDRIALAKSLELAAREIPQVVENAELSEGDEEEIQFQVNQMCGDQVEVLTNKIVELTKVEDPPQSQSPNVNLPQNDVNEDQDNNNNNNYNNDNGDNNMEEEEHYKEGEEQQNNEEERKEENTESEERNDTTEEEENNKQEDEEGSELHNDASLDNGESWYDEEVRPQENDPETSYKNFDGVNATDEIGQSQAEHQKVDNTNNEPIEISDD
ncbi:hypothetical protein EIN_182670 [Entamoeba invadens IP1]|uniref:hypothetical protein n=1 Tax=Entamoeba invadens IP1 TaxID=370355 RepID=UPI0002C3F7E2|nr:hypothetical protein EIN_182670 [Entamoeba invadens IP1]ELP94030.1 hypothetical protein EIN_182670 [Entamoeba invadens IP1]|eukprot:XP_004260801.1 hypothetical protein EIN_182670 [Entamoeba invadens IP1]